MLGDEATGETDALDELCLVALVGLKALAPSAVETVVVEHSTSVDVSVLFVENEPNEAQQRNQDNDDNQAINDLAPHHNTF